MDPVVVYVPSIVQSGSESLGLKALEDCDVRIGECPPQLNAIKSRWGLVLLHIGLCFLLKVLIFFRLASAFVSLLG
jgi:hypothetical protein